MNAKGFQSNSQAATVEQTVAWLHERVSLTAHLNWTRARSSRVTCLSPAPACPATDVSI